MVSMKDPLSPSEVAEQVGIWIRVSTEDQAKGESPQKNPGPHEAELVIPIVLEAQPEAYEEGGSKEQNIDKKVLYDTEPVSFRSAIVIHENGR